MKAKDLMTKEVITIKEEDTIEMAAKILNEKGISGLPVVDEDNEIKGIITEGDLIRRIAKIDGPSSIEILGGILPLERKKDFRDRINRYLGYLVKDMMTQDVINIPQDTAIEIFSATPELILVLSLSHRGNWVRTIFAASSPAFSNLSR